MEGTILIADDDRAIRTVLGQACVRAGCKVHTTASLATLMRWVAEEKGDLVITDVVMPDGDGIEMLPEIAKIAPNLPVIVISAQNTILTAIQATENAAFDYLPKPFDLAKLMKVVSRGLAGRHALHTDRARDFIDDKEREKELPLLGESPPMQKLYRLIAQILNTPESILISGESGTGKTLIGKILHDFSERSDAPFVVVRAYDFMGVEGGGESGVAALKHAVGGSVIIDGLEDFDAQAQMRLLYAIDQVSKQGSSDAPRLLSITQDTLHQKVTDGSFRHDLFYRLSERIIEVPPLRDRGNDILLLADHLKYLLANKEKGREKNFSLKAKNLLCAYRWPGNIRELENTIRTLVLTTSAVEVSYDDVRAVIPNEPTNGFNTSVLKNGSLGKSRLNKAPLHKSGPGTRNEEGLCDIIAQHLWHYFNMHGDQEPLSGIYGHIIREVEKPLIEIVLEVTGGNQAKCAEVLGINRNTLRKKIVELDICVARRRKLM